MGEGRATKGYLVGSDDPTSATSPIRVENQQTQNGALLHVDLGSNSVVTMEPQSISKRLAKKSRQFTDLATL